MLNGHLHGDGIPGGLRTHPDGPVDANGEVIRAVLPQLRQQNTRRRAKKTEEEKEISNAHPNPKNANGQQHWPFGGNSIADANVNANWSWNVCCGCGDAYLLAVPVLHVKT